MKLRFFLLTQSSTEDSGNFSPRLYAETTQICEPQNKGRSPSSQSAFLCMNQGYLFFSVSPCLRGRVFELFVLDFFLTGK